MRMLVRSSSDDCSGVLVDDGSARTSGRVSGTQHVVGGNRSVGPTYIPGRSNTCSTGVLRLYCSSMLSCRSAGALLDLNLTDDEKVLPVLGGARRSCVAVIVARAAAAATGEGVVEQHERKRRRATSVASDRKRIMGGGCCSSCWLAVSRVHVALGAACIVALWRVVALAGLTSRSFEFDPGYHYHSPAPAPPPGPPCHHAIPPTRPAAQSRGTYGTRSRVKRVHRRPS